MRRSRLMIDGKVVEGTLEPKHTTTSGAGVTEDKVEGPRNWQDPGYSDRWWATVSDEDKEAAKKRNEEIEEDRRYRRYLGLE